VPAGVEGVTTSALQGELLSLDRVARAFVGSPPIEALRDATFAVADGEIVGIVGRSGSGKSTLMNVIGLLDRFTGGTYEIEGRSAANLSDREQTGLRSTFFGFVFQQPFLLASLTVQENVELALRPRRLTRSDRGTAGYAGAGARRSLPPTFRVSRNPVGRGGAAGCDRPRDRSRAAGVALRRADRQPRRRTTEEIVALLVSAAGTSAAVIMVTHDLVIARVPPTGADRTRRHRQRRPR